MIRYKNSRKIAVLDENENPVIQLEDTLRIISIYTDFINREVRILLNKGYLDKDNRFVITDTNSIILSISDRTKPQFEYVKEKDTDGNETVTVEQKIQEKLFTNLITPKPEHKDRWAGDFRLADIEQILIDNNLLVGFEIDQIVPQR